MATQTVAAPAAQVAAPAEERKPYLAIYPQSTTFDTDPGYSIRGNDADGVKVDRRIPLEEAQTYLAEIVAGDHIVRNEARPKRFPNNPNEPTKYDDITIGMIIYNGSPVECRVVSKAVVGIAAGVHRFMRTTNTQFVKAALTSTEGATEFAGEAAPVMIPA